jgi:hypothetical protein
MKDREIQASPGQRLLWMLSQYHGLPEALNCPLVCRITGPLDFALLQDAIDLLIARHESLRTTLSRKGRQLRQFVHASGAAPIRCIDLADCDDGERATLRELNKEVRTPIDPTTLPLRITLWRLGPGAHVLCINMHHLVTDTSSCLILHRELAACYAAGRGGSPELSPVGWQFSQFTAWQQRQLAGEGFDRHRRYWQRQLLGVSAPALEIGPPQPHSRMLRNSVQRMLAPDCVMRLQALATREHATLFSVMLSVYYALLNEVTNATDLAVASLFANRTRPEVQSTVGFLTNMLILRTQFNARESFVELVRRVRATVQEATIYQDLPYHLVARSSESARLDEIVFQMLTEPLEIAIPAGDVLFTGIAPDVLGRFPLEMALMPRGREMAAKLYYMEGRISSAWAESLIDAYVRLAARLAASVDKPLNVSTDPETARLRAPPHVGSESAAS